MKFNQTLKFCFQVTRSSGNSKAERSLPVSCFVLLCSDEVVVTMFTIAKQ